MPSLRTILRRWSYHHQLAAAFAELDGYTDRLLSDMGILRDDIAGIAHMEAERRLVAAAHHDLEPIPNWQTLTVTPSG